MQTCIGSENRLSKRERDKGNWTAGAITTCIGSKTRERQRELDGRGDYDLHRFQKRETD